MSVSNFPRQVERYCFTLPIGRFWNWLKLCLNLSLLGLSLDILILVRVLLSYLLFIRIIKVDELGHQEDKNILKNVIIPIALVGLLCALYFYKDSVLNLFGDKKSEVLAEVSALTNDVRRKNSNSIDFKIARQNEPIYHGDSLSTGASSTALVAFKSGQILNVDQNSLIIFDELTDTPEFVKGNIKVTVKGKMKLKVDNQIIEIDGGSTNSDIQIYSDTKVKAKKIVLLKGNAKIQTQAKKEFVPLQKNIPVEPKKIIIAADLLKETQQPYEDRPKAFTPVLGRPPVAASGSYSLYDYYTRMLSSNIDLGRNKGFSAKPNFKFEVFKPSTATLTPQVSDGDSTNNTYLVRINDSESVQGYVVEISQDENFSDQQTQYRWRNSYFAQNFTSPGNYYLRYRRVLAGQVLTDYSPIERIVIPEKPKPVVVLKPLPILAPKPVQKIEPAKPKPIVQEKQVVLQKKRQLALEESQSLKVLEKQPEKFEEPKPRAFGFQLDNRFSTFSAENETAATRAKLLTTRDLNLKVSWQKEWANKWLSAVTLGGRNLSFATTEGGLSSVGNQEKSTLNLAGAFIYNFDQKLSAYVMGGVSQEVFLRDLGNPIIRAEAAIVPVLGVGTQYWLLNRQRLGFGINGKVESYFANSVNGYEVDSGFGFQSAFVLRYRSDMKDVTAGVGYSYKNQGSSNTQQSESGPLIFVNSTFSFSTLKKEQN